MTATRDFLESTSNEFNQAVIRAKEAVTDQKSLRIATRCRQVLEDAWTKYNTAYAQYAAKLKEPATKAEAQSVWLGEMRSYEVALDALEEYLEDQQGEPGNTQGDTAVLLAKEAVAAAAQEEELNDFRREAARSPSRESLRASISRPSSSPVEVYPAAWRYQPDPFRARTSQILSEARSQLQPIFAI